MIIDHIGFGYSDNERSKKFYIAALMPLGIELLAEWKGWMGFGANGKTELLIGKAENVQSSMHIAFCAENREQVRNFYEAAIAAGGKDNGAPGIREEYHSEYYGAFVLDPDGHNIEAVCHKPE